METLNLKLLGRSGCHIEIHTDNDYYFVRKSSKNSTYNQRLILQAEKQKAFTNYSLFFAPKVLSITADQGNVYFDMEYIAGEKYSEYFVRNTKQEIDSFLANIISYITNNFEKSEIKKPDNNIFINKANSLKQELKGSDLEVEKLLNKLIDKIPDTPIPHGDCHGDLTFSNMIFSEKKIYFVDFLDSFFNSPLIDIVKLRQDTCFYWTLMVVDELEPYKKNKMLQIMKYIDEHLLHAFSGYSYFQPWYNYLQCFNLMRILPYINAKQEQELVIKALNTIKL